MEEESIMVPVLSESLRILTVVVPAEFADRLELHSLSEKQIHLQRGDCQ